LLGDGAVAALALARRHAPVTVEFLRETAAGRALEDSGQGEDIELCARLDSIPVLPVFRDRQVGLDSPNLSRSGVKTQTA
jgi:phosphosulfolactate phosphohydrolase-like enzyme